ncbi:hypothetical protein CTAYLR_009592 [Chrysophaeum taylorii]|uniref:GB1/RHD3-type G domain-containing protein n=1 Tax=Chrysophaeum taylorii TaxID=2483200 RepID=A0AAD7UKH8_9STRA|nr:hypothetical protein CTAYLR_009592 [Chrysophaeum taylorii]
MSTTTTTTTEGEAGIVEDDPLRGVPRPLQLVRTGDESNDYAFTLDEANLDELISKVPKDKPVAVVSVVGAFRTGKSFLLTLILRYLRHKTKFEEGDWVTCEGDKISEGNRNKTDSREGYSFEWRGGHERMTTGITVWSEPFFLEDLGLAVVVMDTQGLFDHEAPMALTASIFGLSTLVSSFQLYNVATRIQEDNLQHLALFSEYGRMAIREQLRAEATFQKRTEEEEEEEEEPEEEAPKPFQRLEFLVRDWPELEDEQTDEEMAAATDEYVSSVMASRHDPGLEGTRRQIRLCYDKVTCFLLPHPGLAITSPKYDGSISKLAPLFLRRLRTLMDRVFASQLEPKLVGGRTLAANELATYVRAYAGMFSEGAKFPQAQTVLEATSRANNQNAANRALDKFSDVMDAACGASLTAQFLPPAEFTAKINEAKQAAMEIFDAQANMGAQDLVDQQRAALQTEIAKQTERFKLVNDSRNPFKNAEFYVLPGLVAGGSWVVRHVTDAICPEDGSFVANTCNKVEHSLGQLYGLITFLLLLVAYFKFRGMFAHVKTVLQAAFAAAQQAAVQPDKKKNE